jgi:predicted nucleic acid-binding protein
LLILDTNVISELMRTVPDRSVVTWLDNQLRSSVWITSITVMELHQGIQALPPGRRRTALDVELALVISEKIENRIASFDDASAKATASITTERRRRGRPSDLRDSMIAGMAIATGASLATRNTRHFNDLSITLIDPWTA